MTPLEDLLQRCSWQAEKTFKRDGALKTVLWLTEDAAGCCQGFETGCTAPPEVGNDEALAALVDEMRADFARDGVMRFAVAYPATAHTSAGARARAVAVEAHDHSDHLIGLREVIHLNGRRPELGALTPASAGICRYAGLLVECVPA